MELTFKCPDCKTIFQNKGEIKEINDPVFGPCNYLVSTCPVCGNEAGEYSPSYSSHQTDSGHSCSSGSCCSGGSCSW